LVKSNQYLLNSNNWNIEDTGDVGLLSIGYAEAGPSDGPVVILLHGWPYDIYSFADVTPILTAKGYRVIVPFLRGYGTTKFLSGDTMRNGQQSVVAFDIINGLTDLLKILLLAMRFLGKNCLEKSAVSKESINPEQSRVEYLLE
jgi:hypothetical protein